MNEKLKDIIKHYGELHQKGKAHEELGELKDELIYDIATHQNKQRVFEEMADVYVMLDQLKIIYNISNMDIQVEMNKKVNRQLKRISDEHAEDLDKV